MSDFQLACPVDEVPEGGMQLVELDERLVILFHVDGQYYCLDDVCTHDGGPLSDGELLGCEIACPRHGAKFDVRNGEALTMPATQATAAHEVKLDGGNIYVKINDD
ncbi:MAG: non-heme iron oxygenase ferredoxin subunit [Planctomycetaceae bacterium]|nr:non-heme iron oxygenase ferredoxin subunit [Planctomycetaceae bacterium]